MDPRVGVDGGGSAAGKFLHHHSRSTQPQVSQIGTVPQLLARGVVGAFSKTCTAPLARLTILFQVQGMHSDIAVMSKPSIWREALPIVHEEGFRAFWKGNLVTVAHRLPYSSVNFYAYEHYKIILRSIPALDGHGANDRSDVFLHFVGGGLAGITSASATYPLDLIGTRLAAQRNTIYYKGMNHAFRTICRDEGFLGLYKGMGTTLLFCHAVCLIFSSGFPGCWTIAISFSVYESLRYYWHSHRSNDPTAVVSLVCGSLSGIASSTATFPLDLMRRRMQLEGVAGRARVYNKGLFGTFGQIVRTEGIRGLYTGIMPEYYKVVQSVGIVFMTYETLKKLLSHEL